MPRWDERDKAWRERGAQHGWNLPAPAPWWKRLPGVRLLRALARVIEIERQRERLHFVSFGTPDFRHQYWVAYAVRRGWC